jgi:hypothetical protein
VGKQLGALNTPLEALLSQHAMRNSSFQVYSACSLAAGCCILADALALTGRQLAGFAGSWVGLVLGAGRLALASAVPHLNGPQRPTRLASARKLLEAQEVAMYILWNLLQGSDVLESAGPQHMPPAALASWLTAAATVHALAWPASTAGRELQCRRRRRRRRCIAHAQQA